MISNSRLNGILDRVSNYRLGVFLLLCWILGGTSQDIVGPKLPLYLMSLVMIGVSLGRINKESRVWNLKPFILIWIIVFCIHLIYLIPLPPETWSSLPGREKIVQGFELLEAPIPWLPLSVTPEKTFFSLFDFLPPLAVIMVMGTFARISEIRLCLWFLCGFVFLSVIIGLLQISGVFPDLYFYDFTNRDAAVGVFSNANHYGVQLLMSIPIIFFLLEYYRSKDEYGQNAKISLCIVAIVSAFIGVVLSGSLGAYLLIIPVFASAFFLSATRGKIKSIYLIGIIVPLVGALIFEMFYWNDVPSELIDKFSTKSSRDVVFENTYELGKAFFPFGSGPGSFSEAYLLIDQGETNIVPHAHNEYIETFLELGVIGIIGFLLLSTWLAKLIWTGYSGNNSAAKYMSISIAIVVIHSLFDYSLRTINIMTLMSFCICTILLTNKNVSLNDKPRRNHRFDL